MKKFSLKTKNIVFLWLCLIKVLVRKVFQQASVSDARKVGVPYIEAWGALCVLGVFLLLFFLAIGITLFSPVLALGVVISQGKGISATRDVMKELGPEIWAYDESQISQAFHKKEVIQNEN